MATRHSRIPRLRLILAGTAAALALAGCTTVADVITQAAGGYHVGESRVLASGGTQTLFASFDGWTVWEIGTPDRLVCYAVKAGSGRLSPEPIAALGVVLGNGGGVFMRAGVDGAGATARLYGGAAFVRETQLEVDGRIYERIDLLTAIRWEGRAGFYSVASAADARGRAGVRIDTGVLDFTGIARAWNWIKSCGRAAAA
jgi:hypothetical protein